MRAILAGGPSELHGRILDLVHEQYVTLVQPPTPLYAHLPPPRPRFWADPIGYFRWKPGTTLDMMSTSIPAPVQHLYRAAGWLDDDTRVYWWQGTYAGSPPPARDDVLALLYQTLRDFERDHIGDRAQAHWEMGPEWFEAVQNAAIGLPFEQHPNDMLTGYSVKVTTGSPRLVTTNTPPGTPMLADMQRDTDDG